MSSRVFIIDQRDKIKDERLGRLRYMGQVEGYVVCRHHRAMPFVIWGPDWNKLPNYRVPASEGEQE